MTCKFGRRPSAFWRPVRKHFAARVAVGGTDVAPRNDMANLTGEARPASPVRRPAPANGAPPFDGEGLAVRLRDIGTTAAAPVDALEPALRAILETTGAA